MKSLKLKDRLCENVTYFCDEILVDSERLESDGAFNTEKIDYIICIFENTSDYRFHICVTQKYKEVMEFIKKICVCNKYVMRPDDIIIYGSIFQEDMHVYHNIVESKR